MIFSQAVFTIILLIVTLVVLAGQWLRTDLMALLVMLALVASRILDPGEAFSAFGQPVILIVAGVFVIGAALLDTGVATLIANQILRFGQRGEAVLMLIIMLTAAILTAFLDGLLTVALLLPAVLKVARQAGIARSRLLLPLATMATLGNQLTLVGTTSNLVVSDILTSSGFDGFGLFTLTPYALVVVGVAMAWYLTAGRRLLPHQMPTEPQRPTLNDVEHSYQLRNLLYRLRVRSSSDLISYSLEDSAKLRRPFKLNVVAVQPQGGALQPASAGHVLEQDDILIVEGDTGHILQTAQMHNLEPKGPVSLDEFNRHGLATMRMAELMIPIRSAIIGRSLTDIGFRRRYGLNVLAVHRQDQTIRTDLPGLQLAVGDSLLVQGPPANLQEVGRDLNLVLITDLGPQPGDEITASAGWTLAILAAMLALVVLNIASLAVASLAAAVALVLLKCVSPERAYQSINLSLLVVIGGMLSLSFALQKTGAAELIAQFIAGVSQGFGVAGSMAVIFLLTALVAQVIGGSVAAALFTPIAISLAVTQGAPPQPFAIAIAFAIMGGFMTPITDGDNLLVRDPGQYTMRHYISNTIPIFLLYGTALMALLTVNYGLW